MKLILLITTAIFLFFCCSCGGGGSPDVTPALAPGPVPAPTPIPKVTSTLSISGVFSISAITTDSSGSLYLAADNVIYKIAADGTKTALAGVFGSSGCENTADAWAGGTRFFSPSALAIDSSGNIYVIDSGNYLIRKISTSGIVTTVAGSCALSGTTNGTGSAARFGNLNGIAVDSGGNLFVSDGNAIRKITPAGSVSTFAGVINTSGYQDSFSGSPGIERFTSPSRLATDAADNIFVLDGGNCAFRKITSTGFVTTILRSCAFNDGPLGTGGLGGSVGISLDDSNNIYLADVLKNRIRKVDNNAQVLTITGSATDPAGYIDGILSDARFDNPTDISLDGLGNIYVVDNGNNKIRKVPLP